MLTAGLFEDGNPFVNPASVSISVRSPGRAKPIVVKQTMFLRPKDRLQLHEMIEAAGFEPSQFTSGDASALLPTGFNSAELQKGEFFSYPECGAFFVFTEKGQLGYSPFREHKYFWPTDHMGLAQIVHHFSIWLKSIVAENETILDWEAESYAAQALSCLTKQQLAALYSSLKSRNLAVDLWRWAHGSQTSCSIHSTKLFRFEFRMSYVTTRDGQAEQASTFSLSMCPGHRVDRESRQNLSWKELLTTFDRWAACVAEDLPAEQKLRAPREAATEKTHRISRLELSRVRMFRSQDLAFGEGNLILLLGNNGAGKSTLLRCFALGSATRTEAQELLNQEVARVTSPGDVSTVKLTWRLNSTLSNEETTNRLEISLNAHGQQELLPLEGESGQQGFPGFVAGYGSNRGYYGASERHKIATWGLFNYGTALANPELAVRRLYDHYEDEAGFNQALRPIYELLGQTNTRILKPSQGQVWVQKSNDEKIAFDGWADGYRLTLAWLLDLMDRALAKKALGPDGPEGLLLLDEVEQHLHPKLQIGFLSSLQKAFPRLQIVATTHSPSVALGVDPACVRVVRNNGRESFIEQVPDYSGYSLEELVESPQVFDAEIYPPELAKRQDRYKELLSKQGLSEQEQAEVKELGRELWDLVPTET